MSNDSTPYEYKRSYNPNSYGPKNSCPNNHPYRFTKRRRIGSKSYEGYRVWCPCLPKPKANEIIWYHNVDQAITQHLRRVNGQPTLGI